MSVMQMLDEPAVGAWPGCVPSANACGMWHVWQVAAGNGAQGIRWVFHQLCVRLIPFIVNQT